jgi:hypothetical protein
MKFQKDWHRVDLACIFLLPSVCRDTKQSDRFLVPLFLEEGVGDALLGMATDVIVIQTVLVIGGVRSNCS